VFIYDGYILVETHHRARYLDPTTGRFYLTTVSGVTTMSACFHGDQNRRTAIQKILSTILRRGLDWRRFRTTSCWRRTKFLINRALRVRKRRARVRNQSENRLNMAGSYNRLTHGCASYVADSLDRKHFGEAQHVVNLQSFHEHVSTYGVRHPVLSACGGAAILPHELVGVTRC
jgi:hypothetical protein